MLFRSVPGLPAKAMNLVSLYAPRTVLVPIMGNFYNKMSGR